MSRRHATPRYLRWAATSLLLLLPIAAQAEAAPNGRALYHGYIAFAAGRDATAQRLPAEFTACARCHGTRGEGGREGGVIAPPVTWASLIAPRAGSPGFASPEAVRRAISDGVARDSGALSAAMPRFALTATEADALLAFLQRVGTRDDAPPGVERTAVAIGTVLPLSGSAATTGGAVLAGLHDVIDGVNAGGGVNGRQVTLYGADAAVNGAEAAVRQLVQHPVYAVVAGTWTRDDGAADALLVRHRMPHVASLVVRRHGADAGEWSADLLPPLDAQQASLLDAMRGCTTDGERWVLVTEAPVEGSGAVIPGVTWFQDAGALGIALRRATRAGCLGLGLAPAAHLARDVPPGWEQRVVVPVPMELLVPSKSGQPSDLWRQLGRAAARLTVELLSRSGAVLEERSLLSALAGLNGYEPLPGAPVLFTRQRRYAWDAGIVSLVGQPAASRPAPDPSRKPHVDQGG